MTSRAAPERDADRAALRDLLCADGIFRSTPEHPIVSHDGSSIAWMCSPPIGTTSRSATNSPQPPSGLRVP